MKIVVLLRWISLGLVLVAAAAWSGGGTQAVEATAVVVPAAAAADSSHGAAPFDVISMLFVLMLSTFIGIGVIGRVSRLLHTPLMSLTNAISAIAVVGAIIVAGGEGYPTPIRFLGAVALFASMTNIISGFLITDRMLKMFKAQQPATKSTNVEVKP